MNLSMDCTSSDEVLDLRKTKECISVSKERYLYPSPPPATDKESIPVEHRCAYPSPPHATQPYMPLTPPYYQTHTMPYQTTLPPVRHPAESSDDLSDRSSAGTSPPAVVSSSFLMTNTVITAGRAGKPTRPFKAYPKDPLALSSAPGMILGQDSTEEYIEFRQRMLAQLEMVSGRNNANMKRSISPQMPSSTAEMDDKTAAYWERRRKNNEAAKRSRDARRAKEDEIAIRAAFLEQENIKLKYELASLRTEMTKLRSCLAYGR